MGTARLARIPLANSGATCEFSHVAWPPFGATRSPGQVSEWLKEPVLKTGVPATVPWVRIPPCPLASPRLRHFAVSPDSWNTLASSLGFPRSDCRYRITAYGQTENQVALGFVEALNNKIRVIHTHPRRATFPSQRSREPFHEFGDIANAPRRDGLSLPHFHGMTAEFIHGSESVLVGDVVADEYRRSSGE